MKVIFLSSDYTIMWTAIGAIGQALAAILAILALIYSLVTFSKSLKILHYTELDRMYQDLLRIKLEKPSLNNSDTDKAAADYDIYAFMVWNFLETIHDRCKRDKDLCATWYPIIDNENRRHRKWFDRGENQCKFKKSFREFIENNSFSQQ